MYVCVYVCVCGQKKRKKRRGVFKSLLTFFYYMGGYGRGTNCFGLIEGLMGNKIEIMTVNKRIVLYNTICISND